MEFITRSMVEHVDQIRGAGSNQSTYKSPCHILIISLHNVNHSDVIFLRCLKSWRTAVSCKISTAGQRPRPMVHVCCFSVAGATEATQDKQM